MAALAEQLLQAVCVNPGETIAVIAAQVGASARELHRPMSLLKREGRVRSVGARSSTRYFPMTNGAAASA
jgi:DNA-binding Lrp family transcriptional regulator